MFRYLTCKNRALVFAEVNTEDIPEEEQPKPWKFRRTVACKVRDPRTGYERKRHLFAVYFVEIKKDHECNGINPEVFNCQDIRPRHWRLLTRVDNQQDVQSIPIDSPWVPEAFRRILTNTHVMNARMTRNGIMGINEDNEKAMESVRNNIHNLDEANYVANTVSFRCIENFIKATVDGKPLYLDKDRRFNTSMELEKRMPLLQSFEFIYSMLRDPHSNFWPSLITKKITAATAIT